MKPKVSDPEADAPQFQSSEFVTNNVQFRFRSTIMA